MKSTPMIIASVLSLMLASAPAYALGLGLSVGLGASATATSDTGGSNDHANTNLDGHANAAVSGNISGGTGDDQPFDLIALINADVMTSAQLARASENGASTSDAGAWLNSDNQAAFNASLQANADDIDMLQAEIATNASLSTALAAHGLSADDVIAADVTGQGELRLFTHTD